MGTLVRIQIEAEGPALLGLPFEMLRLPDDRLLATHPAAVLMRCPAGQAVQPNTPLAGPLKILVAVGAPDEETTSSAVLDQERELQNILDAVEPANRLENAQVRFLEVGHPAMIAAALERDAYHVLHISCPGGPGLLELEDEEGRAVPVTAEELIGPLREPGRPLPLVFLNACHARGAGHADLGQRLLRHGHRPGLL